jgi:tripartite ATP-independent transporter DctP family solute receptor
LFKPVGTGNAVKKLLRGLLVLSVVVAWPLPPALSAADYPLEYKLSTVFGKPFPWGIAGERWADLVKEKTRGRISIKCYPGASLVGGDQRREYSAIRQGAIDMAIGTTLNWSAQVKELNIFSLPFLMPDYRAIDALTGGEVGRELFKILEHHNTLPLAWGENGFRELSNSKQDICKPDDLKGLKIRVTGLPLITEIFTVLGAAPVQMTWADAIPALSKGVVDGQENAVNIFTVANLPSAASQKNLLLWGYAADPLIFAVNKDVWKSWKPEDQKAVRDAALQAARENVAAARKGLVPPDDSGIWEIEAQGVHVTRLTKAGKAEFRRITRPVYDKWAGEIGLDLVKKAEEAVARHR